MKKSFFYIIVIFLADYHVNISPLHAMNFEALEKVTIYRPYTQPQKQVLPTTNYPIIAIPSALQDNLPMVFLISGDGGWTSFDNSIAESLALKGMPVVGLDSRKFFWNARTPEETATAVTESVRYFMQQWNRKKFILAGYSFGACLVPFIAGRLPASLQESMEGIYGLSPDETADFEIHISDMLHMNNTKERYNVPEGFSRIRQFHPVCIFGSKEDASLVEKFGSSGSQIVTLPGNHHYNNHPDAAAEIILKETVERMKQELKGFSGE